MTAVVRRWQLYCVPVVFALVAHGIGIGGDFVLDDIVDIEHHPVVNGTAGLTDVMAYNYMGESVGAGANTIRPLTTLLFAVEWRIFGASPAAFHALSLIWFAGLVLLVTLLLARFVSRPAALGGGVLFAVLAVHVDAVGMVAHRAEVVSLVFALAALVCALDRKIAAAAGLYVLALLAKESAILLPITVAWWVFATEGRAGLSWRRHGAVVCALVAAAVVFLAARSAVLPFDIAGLVIGADNPLQGQSIGVRLWMPFVLLGKYLQTTVAPVSLAYDYTYDAVPVAVDVGAAAGWIGLAFSLLLTALIVYRVRVGPALAPRARLAAAAAGAFVATYALFSNSVFLIVTLFAERLFLAPSVFLVVLACLGGEAVWQAVPRRSTRRLLVGCAAAFVLLQTALSIVRTREIATPMSLYASQVEAQPESVKGQLYFARELAKAGIYDHALWHMSVATLGRNRYPARFVAPKISQLPVSERLRRVPSMLGPSVAPQEFWRRFEPQAVKVLGAGVIPVIRTLRADPSVNIPAEP